MSTAAAAQEARSGRSAEDVALEPYSETIPGTEVNFEMIPLPGGEVEVPGPDGLRTVEVGPIWIAQTELTWDAYDVYTLGLGAPPAGSDADAIARPSQPYGAPDYGWGHEGYPVISVSRAAAEAFCEWLSAATGQRYRLPTEAEWLHAAQASAGATGETGLDDVAWHDGNASGTTHPVGSREPDALGLYDIFGNAAEWVMTDDGELVTRGGSFDDPLSSLGIDARAEQERSWNERDPQVPPSRWWLTDAPFVGFRIVRDP